MGEDMWMAIHGKVYDLTAFQEEHPGGPEIMAEHAGVDGTEAFEEVFHSDAARELLKPLYKGDLEGYEPKEGAYAGQGSGGGGNNLVLVILFMIALACIAYKVLL